MGEFASAKQDCYTDNILTGERKKEVQVMKEPVVMINLPEFIEEMKFRKAIEVLGTYRSYEDYLDAMITIAERDMEEDPEFLQ
jgi:hypothetical protein